MSLNHFKGQVWAFRELFKLAAKDRPPTKLEQAPAARVVKPGRPRLLPYRRVRQE